MERTKYSALRENGQQSSTKTSLGFSSVQVVLGACMVYYGFMYFTDCNNGASAYLYYGGMCLLCINIASLTLNSCTMCFKKDGDKNCCESCGLGCLTLIASLLSIANLVIFIWGSIVVFGSWSDWSSDPGESVGEDGVANENFCPYTPMMFAFILLVVEWVLMPVMLICACCCAACFVCCTRD